MKDLTGMLLKNQKELKSDQWEIIEFPAILPSKKPVWPQYWNIDELEGVKASISVGKWNAQWMQNPTAEEGSLIKREWWKVWDKGYIPPLQHIIQSYDTAFLKKETADYSAITTWGVFYPDDDSRLMSDPSSAVGFCIHCAFHLPTEIEALTPSSSSMFQYSGHTGFFDGRIAGNSMISH